MYRRHAQKASGAGAQSRIDSDVVSDRSGAKHWKWIGSGDKFAPGLRMSSLPFLDFGLSDDEGVPVPERRPGGSGYTRPAGIGASAYRARCGLSVALRCGTGRTSFCGMGRGASYAMGIGGVGL